MKNRLLKVALLLFSLFIFIPSNQRGIVVILFALLALLSSPQRPNKKTIKLFLINSLPFTVYLLSLFIYYSSEQTPKKLETGLSLIVIPLIFTIINRQIFNKKLEVLLSKTFVFSAALFSSLILIYFAYLGYFTGIKPYGYCLSQLTNKLPLWADHPIYISLTLCISLLFSHTAYVNVNNSYKKLVLISSFLVFGVVLFLSRRGPILALFLALIPILYNLFKISTQKKLVIRIGALVAIAGVSVVLFVKPINKRILEVVKPNTYVIKNETNSTNNRIQIYKCAIELIKNKPILGYGIGRDKKVLYDCYKENLYYLYENKFNTHNQYLSTLLRFGLLGFIVFLFFLYYNYKIAVNSKSTIFLSILIFYTFNFLFENVIERQNGVILFAFLINYYSFKSLERNSSDTQL